MDPTKLIPENKYVILEEIRVCYYSEEAQCALPNQIELPEGEILEFVKQKDNDFIFKSESGNLYVLHKDDLDLINFAAE